MQKAYRGSGSVQGVWAKSPLDGARYAVIFIDALASNGICVGPVGFPRSLGTWLVLCGTLAAPTVFEQRGNVSGRNWDVRDGIVSGLDGACGVGSATPLLYNV